MRYSASIAGVKPMRKGSEHEKGKGLVLFRNCGVGKTYAAPCRITKTRLKENKNANRKAEGKIGGVA